jgi:hypothetical protein
MRAPLAGGERVYQELGDYFRFARPSAGDGVPKKRILRATQGSTRQGKGTAICQGEYSMKQNIALIVASLLSILFVTLHVTDDIVRGMEPGKVFDLIVVPILVIWLYGTLVLVERRSGYVIILLGSLLGSLVPVIHMMGKGVGVGSNIAKSSGAFFFIWTLIALGVTALFSVVLSVRGLWQLPRRTDVQSTQAARA